MAGLLMREEGLMYGSSSGTAMWGANEYSKKYKIDEERELLLFCFLITFGII